MPFTAVCTYCGKGKVRAPRKMIGRSATCPSCNMSFTLSMPDSSADAEDKSELEINIPVNNLSSLAVPAPSTRSSDIRERFVTMHEPVTQDTIPSVTVNAPTTPSIPAIPSLPAIAPSVPMTFAPPSDPNLSLIPGLIGLSLGGLALLSTQVTVYGRWIALGLSAIGLIFGLLAIINAYLEKRIPFAATGLNALILFLVLLFPGWLGQKPLWVFEKVEDPTIVRAVDPSTGLGITADWIDIAKSTWQQDDVRISLASITAGPVEFTNAQNQRRVTKDRFLQITLKLENFGVSRKIDFRGWEINPKPPEVAPKLTDSEGRMIAFKALETGAEVPGWQPAPATLFPGKSSQQLFLFEIPEKGIQYLHFELPGSPFGGKDPVRLQIPRASLPWK